MSNLTIVTTLDGLLDPLSRCLDPDSKTGPESSKVLGGAAWPPKPVPIVTLPATGIALFATEKEKLCERSSPTQSSFSDTNRIVPLAVVGVIVRHAAALARWRRAVKVDSLSGSR